MHVDQDLCIGCGQCVQYCPVEAITVDGIAVIDQDACLECHICSRSKACPVGALQVPGELDWGRAVRAAFSDPSMPHKTTGILGRGTEEMKTNDITGRFKSGRAGVAIEMGRPCLGTSFRDVEKMAMAVAGHGVKFETKNPVMSLMTDPTTGKLMPEVLNERVVSAIVEFEVALEDLAPVLETIKKAAAGIDTVFSLCVATVMDEAGKVIPTDEYLRQAGIDRRPNGKTNVGLGRAPGKE